MAAERYAKHIAHAVNCVMDTTRDLVPPHFKREQMLELRVCVLDAIIQRLQAEREILDKRRD
jgi:hypothetical protein